MGELIKPARVNIITREGEYQLHITVDLNININTGNLDLKPSKSDKEQEENDDKTVWAIPTFKSKDKVKFGKNKEQE